MIGLNKVMFNNLHIWHSYTTIDKMAENLCAYTQTREEA